MHFCEIGQGDCSFSSPFPIILLTRAPYLARVCHLHLEQNVPYNHVLIILQVNARSLDVFKEEWMICSTRGSTRTMSSLCTAVQIRSRFNTGGPRTWLHVAIFSSRTEKVVTGIFFSSSANSLCEG